MRGGLVRGEHHRDDVPVRHFRLVDRGHVGDRLGDDSADGKGRLSARVRDQRHDQRVGAGDPRPAVAQRRDLFARDRRPDLDHEPVHGGRRAGPAARRRAHPAVPLHRLPRRSSHRPAGAAVAKRCEDRGRRDVGPRSPSSSSSAASCSASSPRSKPAPSPASGRSSSPCSSIATSRWRDWPGLDPPHAQDGRHGDDADRLRLELRLRDGADADCPPRSRRSSSTRLAQPHVDPDDDQRAAAGARLPDGHGAADPDLHADHAAGRDDARRRSRALRHDHAAQPRHRPAHAAGRVRRSSSAAPSAR